MIGIFNFKKINSLLVLASAVVICGCNISDSDIKNYSWKYCEGTRLDEVGDFVEFENTNYVLRNDTVFKSHIPVAKIVDTKKSLFDPVDRIIIESIVTKKKGTYCGK
jgi:hypothetical protein